MRYRKLGKWGLRLSTIGLGSYLTFGHSLDLTDSRAVVRKAYDCGVNFFDTADIYAFGRAEEALGKCLCEFKRSSYVLLTKCWERMSEEINDEGLSAKHLYESCHRSLKRLGTDYLDVFMCHRPDPETPLEETIRALEDLAQQGKILYWGVSEWPAHLIVRANRIAGEVGAISISISQPQYSLLYRYPERNLFPATQAEGIGNVVYSALAQGLLSGKYKPGEDAPQGSRGADDRSNFELNQLYMSEDNKIKSLKFSELAREMNVTPAQLAIAWCLRNPAVSSVISGAVNTTQVEENIAAGNLIIPEDTAAEIERIFPPVETVECES